MIKTSLYLQQKVGKRDFEFPAKFSQDLCLNLQHRILVSDAIAS